jgi:hypothetical protein
VRLLVSNFRSRAIGVDEKRDDDFALCLSVACDVTRVGLNVGDDEGLALEVRIRADTPSFFGCIFDQLASGLPAERGKEQCLAWGEAGVNTG